MKDAEFIALLNLYVDHEISAADAARLEAEVQTNPARRKTYQQYCRMQKGCKLLASDFGTVPQPARNVVAFEPRRQLGFSGALATVGALAAAACVAFIFGNRTQPVATTENTSIALRETVIPPAAIAASADANAARIHAVTVPPARTVNSSNSLLLSTRAQTEAMLAAANAEKVDPQFQWMQTVQFAPIQPLPLESFRFERSLAPTDGVRTYTGPRPFDVQAESAAFRFNK
jgi:anti-sigma factor RsiW